MTAEATPDDVTSAAYRQMVRRFQRLVTRAAPSAATVVVLSKGDQELISLDGRRGWHFPQRSDGVYAGHYPADSSTAITHLERLRELGAEFLAIPATSLWWLEKYPEFRDHVERRYRLVVELPEIGFIYVLFDVFDPRRGSRATRTARRNSGRSTYSGTRLPRSRSAFVKKSRRWSISTSIAIRAVRHSAASRRRPSTICRSAVCRDSTRTPLRYELLPR